MKVVTIGYIMQRILIAVILVAVNGAMQADPFKQCKKDVQAINLAGVAEEIRRIDSRLSSQKAPALSCKKQFEELAEYAEDKICAIKKNGFKISGSKWDQFYAASGCSMILGCLIGATVIRSKYEKISHINLATGLCCGIGLGSYIAWKGMTCTTQQGYLTSLMDIEEMFEAKVSEYELKLRAKKNKR